MHLKTLGHITNTARYVGKIQIDNEEYSVNDEFKDGTLQVSDALDLNEIESARLLINAQQDVEVLNRSHSITAVIGFHQQRQFLLECLRLILKCSMDPELEDDIRDVLRQLIALILETKDGPARKAIAYAQKCLRAMGDIEVWIYALGERHQGDLTLGKPTTPEYKEFMSFQQSSLTQQHESLAAVITYLIKANHTEVEDFHNYLDYLVKLDRWNNLTVHYVPVIIAFTSQYGSPEGNVSHSQARSLNRRIVDKDSTPWNLRNLQAAAITWWLSEYSGWYLEQPPGSPAQRVDLGAEATARSEAFFRALRDGAFQCMLSLCSYLRPDDWNDQVRNGLTEYLLRDTPAITYGAAVTSTFFQDLFMEQLESFIDAFITNMPDTLRRLRFEEDDQRKRISSGLQSGVQSSLSEQDMHLERFLVIISYAFENRIEAAQSFWADTDSNLYGFLQWASKRQSTPMVGAFCESLRSISKGEECATSAHRFLLEEGNTASVRIRRSSSLCWAQIMAELNLYTSKIAEHSINVRQVNQFSGRPSSDDIDEPESALMLECYLRLTAHICRESATARSWVLNHPTFCISDVLFLLCNSTVPSRIHACAFTTLHALLVDKSADFSKAIWISLDLWASGGFSPSSSVQRPAKMTPSSAWIEEVTFEAIANDVETTNEFIGLLHSLVSPAFDESGLDDSLPFMEQLGSTYRMPGIDPYIDFVLGRIFAVHVHQLEDSPQLRILRLNILDFIATCLATFNEDLVILANVSNLPIDTAMNTSSLRSYVRLHPFSRVMEWMFNERVLVALFAAAHQDIEEVSTSSPNGPLVLALLRSIDVMNLIMDLQLTYLDIVRPLIKLASYQRNQPVYNPSLASFEDSVATNLNLVVDLGLYCSAGIQQLSVSSLTLLEKLASSRKLNVQYVPGLSKRLGGNRLVGVLEQNNDLERVVYSLVLAMQFDFRELSYGANAPGWTIKLAILDFLNHCLAISPNKPTLAHALLGFSCNGATLDVETDGLFARGSSLFHAILRLTVEYPDEAEGIMQSWSLSLRQKGLQVLSTLWSSPLTSVFTLAELRAGDFLFALFFKQAIVEPSTIWNSRSIKDPEFMYHDSAPTLDQYLRQRCYLYEYISAEIRLVAVEIVPSLRARILSTLFGSTSMPNGDELPNATIFDLFDFIELDFSDCDVIPASTFFAGVDFDRSIGSDIGDINDVHNIKLIEEMIALHLNGMRRSGRLQDQNDEQQASLDAQQILLYFHGRNNYRRLKSTRLKTIKAWVNLLILVIGKCGLDQANKINLILQAFQIIVPKLERYALESNAEAIDLAALVHGLLLEFDFNLSASGAISGGDVTNDRLFQIFRTALRSIHVPDGESQLREILYNICHRYLTGIADAPNASSRRRHNLQAIKTAGEKLIDIICDDAYGGSGTCRISALLLLDSLAALAKVEKSNYLIDSLVRTNFSLVLVETIKDILHELQDTNAKGRQISKYYVSAY